MTITWFWRLSFKYSHWMNLPPLTQCPPAQGSVLLVFLSDAELYSHTEISKWREEIMVNMRKIT